MRSYFAYVFAVVLLVVLTGATGFYAFEVGRNPNVHGFGDAVWWVLVTMATVGYGDIVPATAAGRIVGVFLFVAGIGTLGVSTAAIAAYLIRFDQIDALRMHSLHDHVVICGLGSEGVLLTQAFRSAGYPVIAIEKRESHPHIAAARAAGASVLVGDAAAPETLRHARLDRARHLVVVCGSDGDNVEITAQARAIPRHSTHRLSCSTQILDPELWYALRSWELGARDSMRLEFFNLPELGARAMLARYSPFDLRAGDRRPGGDAGAAHPAPHVLIVGATALSQHLIRHMVRQWQDVGKQPREPLRVTLVDDETHAVSDSLHHRHPELKTLATITPFSMDLRSPEFHRAAFLFDSSGRCVVTHAYVCVDDEGLALSTALLLLNHLRRYGIPVVVRMNQRAGLAALLGVVGARGDRAFEQLHVFSLLEQACQPDLVLRGTNEVLARALHEDYVARAQLQPGNPAAVPWDDLPLEMKESNRTEADHISTKLEAVGCHIVPLTALEADSFEFSPEEVERLAIMEHERWVTERRALGWTLGPRDPEKKTNPFLKPWVELDDAAREMNRNSVRNLPGFLNRAGFTVHRYGGA